MLLALSVCASTSLSLACSFSQALKRLMKTPMKLMMANCGQQKSCVIDNQVQDEFIAYNLIKCLVQEKSQEL